MPLPFISSLQNIPGMARLEIDKLSGGLYNTPAWVRQLRDPVSGQYITTASTRFRHKFRDAEFEAVLHTAALRVMMTQASRAVIKEFCMMVVAQAKQNVKPGVGPGPHPHRTDHGFRWEDTGALESALGWAFEEQTPWGGKIVSLIYVDAAIAKYGVWLELGWHGPSGKFYRYPFLLPAVKEQSKEMREAIGRARRAYLPLRAAQ